MNPYGFVRLGPPGERRSAARHDHFEGHSGWFTCHLTALTHLFIPDTRERAVKGQHATLNLLRATDGVPLLPGSSLKGVIRSVAETISGSCLTLPQARQGKLEYRGRPPTSFNVPGGFEHCRNAAYACPACRLFGLLYRGEVFMGKVTIDDARTTATTQAEQMTIEALMEPKPRHRIWYEDPQQRGFIRGRKFYCHRPRGPRRTTVRNEYNKTIEAVRPGALFTFSLEYTNLADEELALLVLALVLEDPMRHKVGMGKPIGLGSVQIEIAGWEQINRQARYQQLGSGVSRLEGQALVAEIARWQARYHQAYAKWTKSLEDLRRIWTWDPGRQEDVGYPPLEWFRKHPKTPLEEAP